MKKKKSKNKLRGRHRGIKLKWPLLRRLFIAMVLLCLTGTGVWYGTKLLSRAVRITQIEVKGNRLLSDREVIKLSGLKKGTSILSLKSARIRERLLRSAWVKEAYIRKEPPHRIVIYIKEVRPVALLQDKGRLYLIDREANLLESVREPVTSLPLLRIDRKNKPLLKEALLLARTIWREDFFSGREVIIEGSRAENLTLVVDGRIIKIGHGGYREKLLRLVEIEDKIRQKSIPVEFVDLRFDRRVIVRVKREG